MNLKRVISTAGLLSAAAASLVAVEADAASLSGFNTRAAQSADQACVGNYWSGVTNVCTRSIYVQAATHIATSGNYDTNAFVWADDDSTLQTWGVKSTLDWIWTTGARAHAADYYNNQIWASYPSSGYTYVPAGGGLLFQILLEPNQKVSSYSW